MTAYMLVSVGVVSDGMTGRAAVSTVSIKSTGVVVRACLCRWSREIQDGRKVDDGTISLRGTENALANDAACELTSALYEHRDLHRTLTVTRHEHGRFALS